MANATAIILTAEDRTRAAFASAEAGLAGLKGAAGALNSALGAVGLATSVGGLAAYVKSTIDAADAMNDMAVRTGTSVQALAQYDLAARQSGTSLEAVAAAMGKLSVYMAKNREESAALGLTAKDPVEAFAQLADVIGEVEDPAQRNAIAMQVLGKSYAEVMPLLAQGGTAMREQAAAAGPYAERMAKLAESADAFNDSLAAVGQAAQTALLPLVNNLTDAFNAASQAAEGLEGMEAALAGLGTFGAVGQTIAVTWANVAYVFDQVGTELGGIAAQIAAIARGDFKGAGAISKAMKEDAAQARAELDALEQRIMNPGPTLQKIGGNRYSGDTDFIKDQEKAIAALQKSGRDLSGFFDDGDAAKLNAALAKAFDTKPLDDFLAKFEDRRARISQEYAKLKADLTGTPTEGASALDLSMEIGAGRGALQRGDATGAQIAAERAKDMLSSLKSGGAYGFELSYYADQIKALELSMVDAEEKTATAAADAFKKSLDKAKGEIAGMDPIVVPLALDAIANDLRATIEIIRRELAANPLQIPVQATSPTGIYGNLTQPATAVGAR